MSSGIGRIKAQYTSWGGSFLDFDNDGNLDVFIANGDLHYMIGWESLLLENDGTGVFTDAAQKGGAFFRTKFRGRGATVFDFDNDGRMDILMTNIADRPVLLRNRDASGNAWITLDLEGTKSNRDGFGAKVTLMAGGRTVRAEARCPTTYLFQGDRRLHFGLGKASNVDSIEIRVARRREPAAGERAARADPEDPRAGGAPLTASARRALLGACLLGTLACQGRKAPAPSGSLVIAQAPVLPAASASVRSALDARAPQGSRVILALPPLNPGNVRVLSKGLAAAGEPFVTPDGQRALFAGKRTPDAAPQIYEASLGGGELRALTSMPGGATSPTLLADGSVVFVSPVPGADDGWFPKNPAALWALPPEVRPKRLTFGTASVADPTVLADGRILFVSAMPPESSPPRVSLFTVYNDGTGVSPYACQHDGSGEIGRPRELPDGRIAFLSRATRSGRGGVAEVVLSSRPWMSRRELAPTAAGAEPLLHDPSWVQLEAIPVEPRKKPMGRISTIDPAKKSGVIFCIDANHTTYEPRTRAARVRILAAESGGTSRSLGEIPVHADGSFLAEVPADVALGFEALDEAGNVLRRLPPSVWVRPGENRGCIGCHEPHGLAPRNRRPLAVKEPPVAVGLAVRTRPGKSS